MQNTATVVDVPVQNTPKNVNPVGQKTYAPRPKYTMYHATKDKNGAASQWELGLTKKGEVAIFLQIAPQTGENNDGYSTFGWRGWDKDTQTPTGQGINMQLGISDVGELLAVLNNYKPKAGGDKGLYHENNNGFSVLEFSVYEKDGKFVCYSLQVRSKVGQGEQVTLRHSVSAAEAMCLKVLLEESVVRMSNWYI